jgi:hypothetical protein
MEEQNNKKQLLQRIQKTRAPLDALLLQMTEEQMLQPGVEGSSSVKDLLAHITAWEQYSIRRLQAASRDGIAEVYVVEQGEPDDTDAVNALIFARNTRLPLHQVLSDFQSSLHGVLQAVDALSEKDLFDPQGLAQVFGHPVERIIGSDTFYHYPEHIESIRMWLEKHR